MDNPKDIYLKNLPIHLTNGKRANLYYPEDINEKDIKIIENYLLHILFKISLTKEG